MSAPTNPSEQRNAEIWSTRLQRELLALTAPSEDIQDVAGALPPFCSVKDHSLDIAQGIAKVEFLLEIAGPKREETSEAEVTEDQTPEPIVILLDASLPRTADGSSIDVHQTAYPFVQPHVLMISGASRFPPGSTIQNNDELALDCDWTPSLHLSDVVLNIGLLIKESILQGEPYHPFQPPEEDPVEELAQTARRFGSFLKKSAKQLTTASPAAEKKPKKKKRATVTSTTDLKIGDEINLLESPWVDCRGIYSCKAIRRPGFVSDAMVLGGSSSQNEVAGSGFAGAGAMFRSFTKSAKSLVEESFLMITDTHVIELKANKLNLSTGTITFVIAIDMMAKLKFRREESISLFFKPAPDDPLVYMCPDSADAVRQIQSVLQSKHGVKGKHSNAATQRAVNEALQLVRDLQAKERALQYQPSTERVNEIMDLYRQAAERFEAAGDPRHEEVVTHMRKFLDQPLVVSILDGSYVATEATKEPTEKEDKQQVPQGEVLERTPDLLDGDDDDGVTSKTKEDDEAFTENMDNILKEAQEDLENLNVDGAGGSGDLDDLGSDSAIADIDAMLSAADKELADIMNS